MSEDRYELVVIGRVESSLTDVGEAPKQGDEGAPEAWIIFEPDFLDALKGLAVGDGVFLFTWLHQARRDVLEVHPRGDSSRPEQGVFSTRSPHRPNPIGLHLVKILSIESSRIRVTDLEAVDGTPVVDVKPMLDRDIGRR